MTSRFIPFAPLVLAALLVIASACSTPPSKEGSNNGDSGTNSQTTDQTNNELPACTDTNGVPLAPERLLGLDVAPEQASEGTLTEVTVDSLTIGTATDPVHFQFQGPDLTEYFSVDDTVTFAREQTDSGFDGQQVDWVSSAMGSTAEIGRGWGSSFEDPASAQIEFPLSSGSTAFGPVDVSNTCTRSTNCGPQSRTRQVFDIDASLGSTTETIARNTTATIGAFEFTAIDARATTFALVESEMCVEEGGSDASIQATVVGTSDVN